MRKYEWRMALSAIHLGGGLRNGEVNYSSCKQECCCHSISEKDKIYECIEVMITKYNTNSLCTHPTSCVNESSIILIIPPFTNPASL